MAEMSVSGIASGIDWDSMIEKILKNASKPANVQLVKRDKLEAKKSLFQEFQIALQAVQRSLSSLKLPSTYTAKGIDIARLDNNTSYKSVLNATANSDASIDLHTVEVVQVAKAQVSRSNMFSPTAAVGVSGGFDINVGGRTVSITGIAATDTLQNISDKINQVLKTQVPSLGVTAAVLYDRLVLQSDNTGTGAATITSNTMTTSTGTGAVVFADGKGNPYTLDMSQGKAVVKNGSNTYTQGVHFDIHAGNQITWRTTIPSYATAGDTYQVEYQMAAAEKYTNTITRGSGKIDGNALPPSASPLNPSDVTVQSLGGYAYRFGMDYIVSGPNGRDIEWLDGGLRPPAGVAYEVVYTEAGGGPSITVDVQRNNTDTTGIAFAALDSAMGAAGEIRGTVRGMTYIRGVDFDLVQDAFGDALVQWKGRNPLGPRDAYDFQTSGGGVTGFTGLRADTDTSILGQFFSGGGNVTSVQVNGTALTPGTDYNYTAGLDTLQWLPTIGSAAPAPPASYAVEYTYDANPFTLSDGGSGILTTLGLNSAINQTAAQDAILVVDGNTFTRSSNLIGESYSNEIIKGVTLDIKGPGEVELDVFLNAETAITAIQDFLTAYNDVLGWINTRMTEKEVDASVKATLDSDDFRMRWGHLNGNSLLRSSKNTLRRLTSQVYAPPFTQRTSRGSVWGTNSLGHLIPIVTPPAYQPPSETFNITVDGRTLIAKVDPGQTLADVVANINNPNWNPTVDSNPTTAKNPLFYDENGVLYAIPLARAKVGPNNTLVVETMDSTKPVTLGGTTSMLSTLQVNFEYTTLSEVGIKLPSYGTGTEEAKIGTLEFDVNKFMTAIENNPQDLAALMTTFAGQMDTYMNDMLRASQKEVAPGITTTQGAVVREMEAIDAEIKRIDKYLAEFDRRLEMKRSSLFDQFSAAETSLAKLMEQANWLASVTSQLQSAS